MDAEGEFVFGAFRLDLTNRQLWRGEETLAVRPKLFAVLRYLVQHPGRLIAREELLRAVWGRTHVDETLLRGAMRDLRALLDDDADAPHFIETVPHRGYRFLAKVAFRKAQGHNAPAFLEREGDIEQLHAALDRTLDGQRQLVFVTGEPGIGKTTLSDRFVAALPKTHSVLVARGQCVEQYGGSEAYLPVLEALGRLCRQPTAKRVLPILQQYAPTWLAQMPALLTTSDMEALQRKIQGAGRERMLREMAEALEALTAEIPLVLLFEDLHWSDHSTLDLIGVLARRREPARLMIVATYRPADVIVSAHPLRGLKQELHSRGLCAELPLGFLSEQAVHDYVTERFDVEPERSVSFRELASSIHRRTDGNPLFVVSMTDYLVSQGAVKKHGGQWLLAVPMGEIDVGVPEGLKQLVERQLERLTEQEQRLLEVASVVGRIFSTASVSACLGEDNDTIDELCDRLSRRRQFLDGSGALASFEGASLYTFGHDLYQRALYDRLSAVRRARLHGKIAEHEEQFTGDQAPERAAQLAVHFERAHDYARAIPHLKQAAANALRRNAFQEAIALLRNALALLTSLPDTKERKEQELSLQMLLTTPLLMTKGYGSADVAQVTARARELCQQLDGSPEVLPALLGIARFYYARAELKVAAEIAEQCIGLADSAPDPLPLITDSVLAYIRFSRGELLAARHHAFRGAATYDIERHGATAFRFGDDPAIMCLAFASMTLWALGYFDQAIARAEQTRAVAKQLGIPYIEAFALSLLTWIYLLLRQSATALVCLDELDKLSSQHGFPYLLTQAMGQRGIAMVEQAHDLDAAIRMMEEGPAAQVLTGVEVGKPWVLCRLAEALARVSEMERAHKAADEGLAVTAVTGDLINRMQLLRLKGELLLLENRECDAETFFTESIAIARRQEAKGLELAASTSLSKLWAKQGKRAQAKALLSDCYGWFSEGFDSADLRDAKALLDSL